MAYKALVDPQKALNDFTTYINLLPEDADGYRSRAQVYKMLDNSYLAALDQSKADQTKSGHDEDKRSAESRAVELNNQATKVLNSGDLDLAIQKYREALKLNPAYSLARENLAIALNNQALKFMESGNLQLAIQRLQESVKLNPSNSTVQANLEGAQRRLKEQSVQTTASTNAADDDFQEATELRKQHRYRDEIASLDRLIGSKPGLSKAYRYRGAAYQNLGEMGRSLDDCTQAIKIDPTDWEAYNNRGNGQLQLKQYQKAIDDLTQAIRLNPENQTPYNNRALCYVKLGEYQKAIDDCTNAIKLAPQDSIAHNFRAAVYWLLRDYQKVIADCNQAITLNPKYADAYMARAGAYEKLGLQDLALKDKEMAKEFNSKPEKN